MDKLTKKFIRFLKDKGIYDLMPKDEYISTYIKTININTFIKDLYLIYGINTKEIYDITLPRPICRDFVIININDYNTFCNFLNDNGIVWCNNKLFDVNDVKRYEKNKSRGFKTYFHIDINNKGKLSFGNYYNVNEIWNIENRIVYNENEFYEFYKKYRKQMNDNLLFLGDK